MKSNYLGFKKQVNDLIRHTQIQKDLVEKKKLAEDTGMDF